MKRTFRTCTRSLLWLFCAFLTLSDTTDARTTEPIVYPEGTTTEEAWNAPPKIGPEKAAEAFVRYVMKKDDNFGEERYVGDLFEALKYLKGPEIREADPNAPENGVEKNYATFVKFGQADKLTDEQRAFELYAAEGLADAFGLNLDEDVCLVTDRDRTELLMERHIKWHLVDWGRRVHIFGIVNVIFRFQVPPYESAVVYGVFPIGLDSSVRTAVSCFFDEPGGVEEAKACGLEKDWKVQGGCEPGNPPCPWCPNACSTLKLWVEQKNQTQIPAEESTFFSLSRVDNKTNEFQTSHQVPPGRRPDGTGDGNLGYAYFPKPTHYDPVIVNAILPQAQDLYATGEHRFRMLTGWDRDIVVHTAESNPPMSLEVFDTYYHYLGQWRGNPHNVGATETTKWIRRWHGPFCEKDGS